MKLIIIDRKAWERHCSDFADFIHRIEQLIGNPPETDEWLDNEAVCKRLGISKRTLQSYRDTGKIPFSMIGHKCYYKESDITELLNENNEWTQWMNSINELNEWTMEENEIITQEDPQMQLFSQLMEGILKKLERYCATARPMLGGEVYLTGEEVCKLLRLSTRTLQDYRDNGTIAYCKIGGKILYRQSDIQAMLERHYYPIHKKPCRP